MASLVVDGQEYEYYVDREPVIAFALHHSTSTEGEIRLQEVRPILEHDGPEEPFSTEAGETSHVAFVPGQGAVRVSAMVTNCKTQQHREFYLGLSMRGSRITRADVVAELRNRIAALQKAAAYRAVQS